MSTRRPVLPRAKPREKLEAPGCEPGNLPPRPRPTQRQFALRRTVTALMVLGVVVLGILVKGSLSQAPARGHRAVAVQPGSEPVSTLVGSLLSFKGLHPSTSAASLQACKSNIAQQLIVVSIKHQHAWMCGGDKLVYQSPVTTGASADGLKTPTGKFDVLGKDTNVTLNVPDNGGHYHVRYWIPFKGNLYGFHDASWQKTPFGSPDYRTGGSHGCIHLPLKTIAWLFTWVHVGASVYIEG